MSIHSISKILLATDFSDISEQATEQATALAKALNAQLGVVHVFDPGVWRTPTAHYFVPGANSAMLEQIEEVRHKGHEALENQVKALDVPVESFFVEGHTGREIVEGAEKWAADLIVLGSHGYTGLSRIVVGSGAEHVVRHAPCAVLTVKPKDLAEETEGALSDAESTS